MFLFHSPRLRQTEANNMSVDEETVFGKLFWKIVLGKLFLENCFWKIVFGSTHFLHSLFWSRICKKKSGKVNSYDIIRLFVWMLALVAATVAVVPPQRLVRDILFKAKVSKNATKQLGMPSIAQQQCRSWDTRLTSRTLFLAF